MCGIFAVLNHRNGWTPDMRRQFKKGKARGPELSRSMSCYRDVLLGFHRLAINGMDEKSDQPLVVGNVRLICNGEIYNYKQLLDSLGIEPQSGSDCEVIIHLYNKYGIARAIEMLDGVYALVLLDVSKLQLFVARDNYGVRPMFTGLNGDEIAFASEVKMLHPLFNENIAPVEPGGLLQYNFKDGIGRAWNLTEALSYTDNYSILPALGAETLALIAIHDALERAVKKRVTTTERPIACLLSGGLDSSLVCAIVSKYLDTQLETYSIGLQGSEDLRHARIVARYLGSQHHEIVMTEQEFFDAIPEVITAIESYDTTTVRASVGNYLVGKYIKEHSQAKVIFNGDGSDEVCGGYMYMHAAPTAAAFDKECKRLLQDIHLFDVLRSDRCIAAHGLEARTPFLDTSFVATYMSIPMDLRYHVEHGRMEKTLLRRAFEGYLPNEILYRTKEAFSDGVSTASRSWHVIIREKVAELQLDSEGEFMHNTPVTPEQKYYRGLFEKEYAGCGHLIPYFWMPKFVSATDASARTLDIYKANISENKNMACM
jgi:asparagine synthase (glutamine-hydrolysing)